MDEIINHQDAINKIYSNNNNSDKIDEKLEKEHALIEINEEEIDLWDNILNVNKNWNYIKFSFITCFITSIILISLCSFMIRFTSSILMIVFTIVLIVFMLILLYGVLSIRKYKLLIEEYEINKEKRDPQDLENSNERTFLLFYLHLSIVMFLIIILCSVSSFTSLDQMYSNVKALFASPVNWSKNYKDMTLDKALKIVKIFSNLIGSIGIFLSTIILVNVVLLSKIQNMFRMWFLHLTNFSVIFTLIGVGIIYFSVYSLFFVEFISDDNYNPKYLLISNLVFSSISVFIGCYGIFCTFNESKLVYYIYMILIIILSISFVILSIFNINNNHDFRKIYEGKCNNLVSKFNSQYLSEYADCFDGKYISKSNDISSFQCDKSKIVNEWERNLGLLAQNHIPSYGCLATSCCERTLTYIKDKIDYLTVLSFFQSAVGIIIIYGIANILLKFDKSKKEYSQKRYFILILIVFMILITIEILFIGLLPKISSPSPLDREIISPAPKENSKVPLNITNLIDISSEIIALKKNLTNTFKSQYISNLADLNLFSDDKSNTDVISVDFNKTNNTLSNNTNSNITNRYLQTNISQAFNDIKIIKECEKNAGNCEDYFFKYSFRSQGGGVKINSLEELKINNIYVNKDNFLELELISKNKLYYDISTYLSYQHSCILDNFEIDIILDIYFINKTSILSNSSISAKYENNTFDFLDSLAIDNVKNIKTQIRNNTIYDLNLMSINSKTRIENFKLNMNFTSNKFKQIIGKVKNSNSQPLSNVTILIFPKLHIFSSVDDDLDINNCKHSELTSDFNGFFFSERLFKIKNDIPLNYFVVFYKSGFSVLVKEIIMHDKSLTNLINIGEIVMIKRNESVSLNFNSIVLSSETNSTLSSVDVYLYKGIQKLKYHLINETDKEYDNIVNENGIEKTQFTINRVLETIYNSTNKNLSNDTEVKEEIPKIQMSSNLMSSTKTDNQGKFIINGISEIGDYSLIFKSKNYYTKIISKSFFK